MATSTFDTLSVARELEAKGIEPDQAEAIVKAIRQSSGDHISADQFDARFSEQQAYIYGICKSTRPGATNAPELRLVRTGTTRRRSRSHRTPASP